VLLGWNTIQRRNIGFLEAVKSGAEIIATVDDDNIPLEHWGRDVLIGQETTMASYTHPHLFDPLCVTSIHRYWHRGYPLDLVNDREHYNREDKTFTVKVQAGLWNGTPDVDAISRIMFGDIEVRIYGTFPYSSPCTIFSSQNAFLHRSMMADYAVLPFCGRMDDIWGCILLQQRTGCEVVFSAPSVYQDRNAHDQISDLKEEIIGHELTRQVILKGEKALPHRCQVFLDRYREEMERALS